MSRVFIRRNQTGPSSECIDKGLEKPNQVQIALFENHLKQYSAFKQYFAVLCVFEGVKSSHEICNGDIYETRKETILCIPWYSVDATHRACVYSTVGKFKD